MGYGKLGANKLSTENEWDVVSTVANRLNEIAGNNWSGNAINALKTKVNSLCQHYAKPNPTVYPTNNNTPLEAYVNKKGATSFFSKETKSNLIIEFDVSECDSDCPNHAEHEAYGSWTRFKCPNTENHYEMIDCECDKCHGTNEIFTNNGNDVPDYFRYVEAVCGECKSNNCMFDDYGAFCNECHKSVESTSKYVCSNCNDGWMTKKQLKTPSGWGDCECVTGWIGHYSYSCVVTCPEYAERESDQRHARSEFLEKVANEETFTDLTARENGSITTIYYYGYISKCIEDGSDLKVTYTYNKPKTLNYADYQDFIKAYCALKINGINCRAIGNNDIEFYNPNGTTFKRAKSDLPSNMLVNARALYEYPNDDNGNITKNGLALTTRVAQGNLNTLTQTFHSRYLTIESNDAKVDDVYKKTMTPPSIPSDLTINLQNQDFVYGLRNNTEEAFSLTVPIPSSVNRGNSILSQGWIDKENTKDSDEIINNIQVGATFVPAILCEVYPFGM